MTTHSIENTFTKLKNLTEELSLLPPYEALKEQFRQFHLPRFEWPSLKIGNLTASVPIVQGGMGVGISLSGLAAAVAEAGGIGIIAANAIGMIESDYFKDGRAANIRALRKEIRTARQKTRGILGVNIMVAVNDFHDLMDVAIDEKIDLLVMGAGLPIKDLPVGKMRENGVKAVPIVSSVRAAELIFRMWSKLYDDVPDAVVFEGPHAGGHIGFTEEQIDHPEYQLEAIVPGIVEALKPYEESFGRSIPVIAGGGIFSGEDIHAALQLGASAVQMGTRFVATDECDADEVFKNAYVEATADQIGLIKSPVGMPGRAIRNDFIVASEAGERPSFKCAWKCLSSCKADDARYCISIALNNARRGILNKGFVFAGSNAHRVEKIQPVSSLVQELAEGFQHVENTSVIQHLERMIAAVQSLVGQHRNVETRVGELAKAYESGLFTRLNEARESGVEQLRVQYDAMLSRLRGLQFQIMEKLTETWVLLGHQC